MKVINKTKNCLVASRIKLANNFFTRTVGLLSRNSLHNEEGILISPCNSIHSFFMRFVFDAVFLDKEGKVIYLISEMNPWKVSPYVRKSKNILEVAGGIIQQKNIEIGDILDFID